MYMKKLLCIKKYNFLCKYFRRKVQLKNYKYKVLLLLITNFITFKITIILIIHKFILNNFIQLERY